MDTHHYGMDDFGALALLAQLTGAMTAEDITTVDRIVDHITPAELHELFGRVKALHEPTPGGTSEDTPERWAYTVDREDPTAVIDGFAAVYPTQARPDLLRRCEAAVFALWQKAAAIAAPEILEDGPESSRALFDEYLHIARSDSGTL